MEQSALFWLFAAVSVLSALGVVFARSIIYSGLSLFVLFMTIAGVFLLNNADFLAIAQVLVYAVGLTIILLFAIMFTGHKHDWTDGAFPKIFMGISGVVAVYVAVLLVKAVIFPYSTVSVGGGSPLALYLRDQGSTAMLGTLLMSKYGLPFELASILLLVAMIGAIVLAKRSLVTVDLGDTKLPLDTESILPEDALAARQAEASMERALGLPPKGEKATAPLAEESDTTEEVAGANK